MTGGDAPGTSRPGRDDADGTGDAGDIVDTDELADARGGDRDAERVIRHRLSGHRAALDLAGQVDEPELLAAQIEETEHRLAEDQDILEEIAPEDPAG